MLLALIPFIAMCFSVPLWDRVHPVLLGLPFNIVWITVWIVLSSLCMWCICRIERTREAPDGRR